MNLSQLKQIFQGKGVVKLYYKRLAPNDNSKNQVYLGGSFDVLNILPFKEIITDTSGDWSKERFKARLEFYWLTDDENLEIAPAAQLILYPKYPEVRFSGFLKGCRNAPSQLMTSRIQDRILFLGVTADGKIIGYVIAPESNLSKELFIIEDNNDISDTIKALDFLPNNKQTLIAELTRIHELGWIESKRLDHDYNILPCKAPNCGGYTLEAELGITPNGYAEPDYLGWEIKQFSVSNFNRLNSSTITLMTPEPTGGVYSDKGLQEFVFRYGYKDLKGRENRYNFGGIHKVGQVHSRTGLKMILIGFDEQSGKIRNTNGRICLVDENENEAASWSFSSLLKHWNRKHNQACYVPSLNLKTPYLQYQYGDKIILGTGTDFQLLLKQFHLGNVYYDPGIKIENINTKPTSKRRSQFRIKSRNLSSLYKISEIINLA